MVSLRVSPGCNLAPEARSISVMTQVSNLSRRIGHQWWLESTGLAECFLSVGMLHLDTFGGVSSDIRQISSLVAGFLFHDVPWISWTECWPRDTKRGQKKLSLTRRESGALGYRGSMMVNVYAFRHPFAAKSAQYPPVSWHFAGDGTPWKPPESGRTQTWPRQHRQRPTATVLSSIAQWIHCQFCSCGRRKGTIICRINTRFWKYPPSVT